MDLHQTADSPIELSIVMPCLDEAETLATCIRHALRFLAESGVVGEVVVADNGSTDGSQEIAAAEGARLVSVAEAGYGAALIGGIEASRGVYVAMGDADDSYDFESLGPFIDELRTGADLVMGNRFRGGIGPGAMPPLHRYVGNPLLSFVGRLLFRVPVRDFHCGLRAFRRDSVMSLNLRTSGMEFASEMVVRARLAGLDMREVPTTLRKDGRSRPPHLRSFRDGWRHLRFLMLFSPRWLLLYPGALLACAGLGLGGILLGGQLVIGRIALDVGSLMFCVAAVVVGYQAVIFAGLSKVYAEHEGFLPAGPTFASFQRRLTLENLIGLGAVAFVVGIAATFVAIVHWSEAGFGDLNPSDSIRATVPAMVGLIVGIQTMLAGLFLSFLRIRVHHGGTR